jgi:hypothetical protein
MGAFSFLGRLYDLDTLDTRFTVSSATPYRTVLETRHDAVASRERAEKWNSRAPKSRWRTPEFYLYYVVCLVAVPYMFWTTYDASRSTTYKPFFFYPFFSIPDPLPSIDTFPQQLHTPTIGTMSAIFHQAGFLAARS